MLTTVTMVAVEVTAQAGKIPRTIDSGLDRFVSP
jgi:hypothetical protein